MAMTPNGHSDISARWVDVPTRLLYEELARRQQTGDDRPPCGSGKDRRTYNTSLHVAALFLILVVSTLACSFPVIVRRFPTLPIPNKALFFSRHFGTGVLIATAFVHLFPTAYISLTDRCLPRFWNETYPPMPGFIAMASVLVVVSIEMFFATKGAGHSHSVDLELLGKSSVELGRANMLGPRRRSGSVSGYSLRGLGRGAKTTGDDERGTYSDLYPLSPVSPSGHSSLNKPLPLPPRADSEDEDDSEDLDLDQLDPQTDSATEPLTGSTRAPAVNGGLHRKNLPRRPSADRTLPLPAAHDSAAQIAASEQRMVLQCLMLEAGILFHSVFIGMALSVAVGPAFIVLLIAITFHQTFEGLALGSRIAAITSFPPSSFKPWVMSLMYGITTPVGQAIGLAVQGLYDPASQLGLLMVGIVNAVSTGLLIYAGLVQLLAEDFLTEQSYQDLQGKRRLQACGAVLAGSMLMAFVGAFA